MAASIDEKERHSREIIMETRKKYGDNAAVAFSGSKDSTVLLHLVRSVFGNDVPWRIVNIDTGAEFPEIKSFIHRIKNEWNLNLMTLKNNEALKTIEIAGNTAECCYHMKVVPMSRAILEHGFKAVLTAERLDEQADGIDEDFFTTKTNPVHIRAHPVLHFREMDIWAYIKKYGLAYCELYKKGYRSIDCMPCTGRGTGGGERDSRDREKDIMIKHLKSLGYF